MRIRKKAQFNFVWMFAIVIGGAILFLAIYGAIRAGDTIKYQTDTELAKQVSILTDPLQAGFASSSYGSIEFSTMTTVTNYCFSGGFGRNEISVKSETNIGNSNNLGAFARVSNKYIFSEEKSVGEKYYVFSKPFDFPYKVSDMIFLIPEDYCFVDSFEEVGEEIGRLGIPNIDLVNDIDECLIGSSIICFGPGGPSQCDTKVVGSYESGTVLKNGASLEYVDSLIYGAIFSDPLAYECNVDRLLFRASKIAEILQEKTDYMNSRGCNNNLKPELIVFENLLSNSTSSDLFLLRQDAEMLDKLNVGDCKLW